MKFINKGVARRGAEGAAAPRHVTAPPLGGSCLFSGQLKKSYKDNWKISFKRDKIYEFV